MNNRVYLMFLVVGAYFSGMFAYHIFVPTIEADKVERESFDFDQTFMVEAYDLDAVIMPDDHEEMQGRYGFYRNSDPDTIYLQYPRDDLIDFYHTCVHEELHMRGIGEEEHSYIYEVEDTIVSENCIKVIKELGKAKATTP